MALLLIVWLSMAPWSCKNLVADSLEPIGYLSTLLKRWTIVFTNDPNPMVKNCESTSCAFCIKTKLVLWLSIYTMSAFPPPIP